MGSPYTPREDTITVITSETADRGRMIGLAGLVFVAAWVVGLLVAPSSPAATDPASSISSYYLAHRRAAMLQTFLVDGVAGAALLVFAAALKGSLRKFQGASLALSDVVLGAGVAAASVSFLQAAVGEVLANRVAGTRDAVAVGTLFDVVNEADAFKLVALAVMIGAVAVLAFEARALPRWLGWASAVLSPALAVGGLGFVINNAGLTDALFVLLPLLLVWVAVVSIVMWRRNRPEALYITKTSTPAETPETVPRRGVRR